MKTDQSLQRRDSEVVVHLRDGWTLRSGVDDPNAPGAKTSGDYVRVCKPDGTEQFYWDKAEWKDDPARVMGAIINAAAGHNTDPHDGAAAEAADGASVNQGTGGRVQEVEAELALHGYRMEPSLAVLSGDGDAIIDVATGDFAVDSKLSEAVVRLAEEWTVLMTPSAAEELPADWTPWDRPRPPQLLSIGAGARALKAHREALGIEGDEDTQVWHLLVSLVHWCAARGVDLSATFALALAEAEARKGA